ncbi:DNase I-like protein [Fomitiporia mediterranea MF3/22]|uniref:DNase I-like protein n=1 Tax=Fomitiporia mediterranea (strain MF3/22) TaxID=694068 RepID=UPI000440814A|nr:DNase I-like protein [Fomitiporia mediterranea MF3/22]EJD06622.1 DNase I-like protein [Fomitiporia mediterranea MF3/22]
MSRSVARTVNVAAAQHEEEGDLTRTDTKGSSRARTGQQTVFSRLQSLFPNSTQVPRTPTSDARVSVEPSKALGNSTKPPPRFLKVHIVTWNMHDALPTGNLEDLLGAVPQYIPCPDDKPDKLRIPNISEEDCHPYHLVVVAGQECPTVSGIPKGIGASFRHKDKDKHKDGEKGAKKIKGKDGKEKDDAMEPDCPPASNQPPTSNGDAPSASASHSATSGWSWILEEWYCHGLGQLDGIAGTSTASELYDSQAAGAAAFSGTGGISQASADMNALVECDEDYKAKKDRKKKDVEKKHKNCCLKDKGKIGPYELLVKERLMGIYMAIFIYRDLKPLVRGISKSSVSTGLIGGRVGNKGGVGISVNLDGTTLLFINAHLAAHEDRVMNRLSNFNKIKSELQVNDFLSQDDPRVMSEDLIDKFDYTFVFGDLNFRLDVTRLHADWLISRQDYDQALSFDQLRGVMRRGEAFVGFNEAPIRFPPTFKYDVMKTLKRDKSNATQDTGKSRGNKRWVGHRSNQNLSEVRETDNELSVPLTDGHDRGGSLDAEDDNGSFVSTALTGMSMQTRTTANGESDDNDGFYVRAKSPGFSTKSKDEEALFVANNAAHKLFLAKAAMKAKEKWLSMLKSRSPVSRNPSQRSQHSFSASLPQLKPRATSSASASSAFRGAASALELGRPSAPSVNELRRTPSKKSVRSTKSGKILASASAKGSEDTKQESDVGVYDSSSKQRVPSWCDRILWKTTIQPEPDSEDENEPDLTGHHMSLGPRMLAFLTNALRPLSTRTRTASLSSIPIADLPSPIPATAPSRPATSRSDSQPLTCQSPEESEENPGPFKPRSLANIIGTRGRFQRKARHPKLLKSRSIEPVSTTPLMPSSMRKRRSRAYTAMPVISAPVVTLPEDTTPIAEMETPETSRPAPSKDSVGRQRTTSSRGWLRLPFFNREADHEPLVSDENFDPGHPRESIGARPRRHRRGEVVALGYNSLDDQAMRRLEGRSDHRPVIGSYAIYI